MFRHFVISLKEGYLSFTGNDPLRMAAATAFFTTFALPPILFIIIRTLGLLFNARMGQILFAHLAVVIGSNSATQVRDTLRAFRQLGGNWYVGILVATLLAFVATNLFKIIQDSINQLWRIRMIHERNFLGKLVVRWNGVMIILATAFLFSLAILAEGLQSLTGEWTREWLPQFAAYLNNGISQLFSILLVACWFALLFRVLPDGRPHWRTAIAGGIFTSLLFAVGKFALRILLIQSNVNSLFGASAAFVLLLLFVFYSSMILYFGAAFTKAWGELGGKKIVLKKGAMYYRLTELRETAD